MATIETNDMMTTIEAAEFLGDGTRYEAICKHCQRKTIEAIKIGNSWLISRKSLADFKENRRSRGRPKTS